MAKQDFQKVDAEVMNLINRRRILQLIRQSHSISRSELVKLTGLAAPTVSRIVDRLVREDNLVRYSGKGNSSGGRPPVIVEFNGTEKYVLGVDLGATMIRGVLANLDAEILMEIQAPTGKEKGYENVLSNLVDVVERLLGRLGKEPSSVIGLGVGVAGLLDKSKNIVRFSPDFKWTDVNLVEDLSKKISIPISIENSTRLMALGELGYGRGKELEDFIVVNVGYGIAAGIVVDGKVVDGADGFSGEFGHMTVNPSSEVICDCGRKGCVEALASGRRIGQLAREMLPKDSLINELCGHDPSRIDAKMAFEAFEAGDQFAAEICIQAIDSLSVGLANLIHLLDPTHVLLGGGVSLNGDKFWDTLLELTGSRILVPNRAVKIEPASFREYSTVIGSLALVLDSVLGLELR
jgi:predicted NBD/HSP70 family sugar kinase